MILLLSVAWSVVIWWYATWVWKVPECSLCIWFLGGDGWKTRLAGTVT